jgi:hypothetical protein
VKGTYQYFFYYINLFTLRIEYFEVTGEFKQALYSWGTASNKRSIAVVAVLTDKGEVG